MPTNASPSTENIVRQISRQLAFDFGDRFTDELIEKHVSESLEALGPARVRTYLPLLVHRSARARLVAAAVAEGSREVG